MKKILIIVTLVFLLAITTFNCKTTEEVNGEPETPPANTVYIYDGFFTPATLTVSSPNTVITWVNKGTSDHTATSGAPAVTAGLSTALVEKFNSGTLRIGESFKHTFQWEGNWKYYCQIHPQMRAEIKVKF